MAHALASHGVAALKNGLKLIQRDDVKLNPAAKAKPGGFAIVHQGIFNGELVAVKIPKDACSLTEKQFKEFVRELTVMASVKHPHCVTLLAACEDRTDPLLVMEWVSGGNLFEALGRDDPHALPWNVRLRIAREIASAIEFLHKCKISHGDLKSMNVLLTSDFISKICDFGAAIQRLSTTAIMSSKTDGAATLQYTLHYSAPELLKGAAANTQTDMYAFGIIMYELLTCQPPFAGVNPALLRDLIVKEGLRPDVPDPHASQFPPPPSSMSCSCAGIKTRLYAPLHKQPINFSFQLIPPLVPARPSFFIPSATPPPAVHCSTAFGLPCRPLLL
jgi:serine/threonine protein kinase